VGEVQINATADLNVTEGQDLGSHLDSELLAELLACEDDAFIRRAYWVLLGRGPDPDGLANYLARVRAGSSRLQVLSELAGSSECKSMQSGAFAATSRESTPPAVVGARMTSNVATSYEQLLARQGAAFVMCAYQTLLGRDPDCQGMRFYAGELRRGTCKVQILAQIRHSAEFRVRMRDINNFPRGLAVKRMLPRLDWEIAKFWLARTPLLGWLLRSLTGIEGNSSMEIRLRKMEFQLASLNHVEEDVLVATRSGHNMTAAPLRSCEPRELDVNGAEYGCGAALAPQPAARSLRSLPAPSNWR
jgi:hypothetical protein